MRHPYRCLASAALVLALAPRSAPAQCADTAPLWSHFSTLTPLVSNTGSSLLGRSYHATGSALYAYRNANEGGNQAGTPAWVWSPGPQATTINNFPSPVPMHAPGGEKIYLGGDNGFLYKIDAATGLGSPPVDTRRLVCSADQIIATPAVQLYAFSNGAFQAAHNRDLVFVATRTGCGDMTKNRILAYDAGDLSLQWVFNQTGTFLMDYVSDGGTVDYSTNRLYCGSSEGSGAQPTLWAINTITGSLAWSVNAGPIRNRPQVLNNRIYVGTYNNLLMAYSPSSGAPLWASPLVLPAAVERNPWPEFRSGLTNIYMCTSDGYVRAYRDVGPGAVEIWPASNAGGVGFTTMPVVAPIAGTAKLYIGRNDGKIQQIDASTGALEVAVDAAPAGTLHDPTLDVNVAADPNPNRLLVASTHVVHRYCIPWNATVEVRDEFQPRRDGAALLPNAPNPFRESTRLDYALARPGQVEIQVFDVAGKRLRTWVREHAAAGAQSIVWDGTDEAGRRAPSGVYFCRLRVKDAAGTATERSATVLRLE